jgi:hypothetical protein
MQIGYARVSIQNQNLNLQNKENLRQNRNVTSSSIRQLTGINKL